MKILKRICNSNVGTGGKREVLSPCWEKSGEKGTEKMSGKDYYIGTAKIYVAVDCIIFGFAEAELHLLLVKRMIEPAKGEWSLMGGFVQEEESADEAARRVLKELTGLDKVYMEQVKAYTAVERDPGARVISIAYYALMNIRDNDTALIQAHHACWVKMKDVPPLIFDHADMVCQARELLKRKAATEPVGFQLLPKMFTLTQLQQLYEAVYGEVLDKRNFRKKVAEMGFVEKTGRVDKKTSKRGAALYRFNARAYQKAPKFSIIANHIAHHS